jgi:hypothetical protein
VNSIARPRPVNASTDLGQIGKQHAGLKSRVNTNGRKHCARIGLWRFFRAFHKPQTIRLVGSNRKHISALWKGAFRLAIVKAGVLNGRALPEREKHCIKTLKTG